jgi:D-glycero-alpha-D-manno-heptose-7-phosphate kinase
MKHQSVLTLAPLRISFIGGGTDINYFYRNSPGKVVSAAINKYVYVHVKNHDPLFQERYRISYSEVEHTQSRSGIKNLIIKSCLELLNMDEPLQISTSADLPTSSGLGSSSSFTVALLLALHQLEGRSVSPAQLAEEAAHVEISIMKSPIGKQDHYAAAFGGLNYYEFLSDDSVKIQPLLIPKSQSVSLLSNSLLLWTGEIRSATKVLQDQEKNFDKNEANLISLTKLVDDFKFNLLKKEGSLIEIGKIITSGWEIKNKFSSLITTPKISEIISELKIQNCLGYKLLGAGGGGFVYALFIDSSEKYINKFPNRRSFVPNIDNLGARVVSSN